MYFKRRIADIHISQEWLHPTPKFKMNAIRKIRELNEREIAAGISPEGSWHADYRDTAYVYIGGLPFELSEGDIMTIFSQFGEPVHIHLVRDKETGKSKGFAFLKYEDQRSTDLAVDNLGGATVMGRMLRVDHTRYKKKDNEDEDKIDVGRNGNAREINKSTKSNGDRSSRRDRSREKYRKHREHRSRRDESSSGDERARRRTRARHRSREGGRSDYRSRS